MTTKPTYEELQQRVKELEKEAIERKGIEGALLTSEEQYRTLFVTMAQGVAKEGGQVLNLDRPDLEAIIYRLFIEPLRGDQMPNTRTQRGRPLVSSFSSF